MHPVLRQAEDVLRGLLASVGRAYIPPDIEVSCRYNFDREEQTFRFAAGDYRTQLRIRRFDLMSLPPQQRGNLPEEIRAIWRRLVNDLMLNDTRVTVSAEIWTGRRDIVPIELPPGDAQIAAEWGRYDGMIFRERERGWIEVYGGAAGGNGGAAGGGMTANQAPGRRQVAIDRNGDPCTCPSCRPALEAKRQADAAESRSIELLKEWLSPDQRAEYERGRCITVTGSAGTRYAIHHGRSGNVYELGGSYAIRAWCFGPQGEAGRWTGDVMLAQMLSLQNDEMEVRKVANLLSGQPPEWYAAERATQEAERPRNPRTAPL